MIERPTIARLLLASALALPVARGARGAAPTALLDEDEAVRRALARPALAEELRARVDLARADELGARRWPNPEISWSHEEIRAAGATERQDVALLSQRLDLAGRRGLRGDAAARRVEAADADAALARLEVESETRRTFANVLAGERRVAVLNAAAERLARVAAAVERRSAAGDVAGYDRRRVERERLTTLGRLDAEEGALARARARLAALVGAEPSAPPVVQGDLTETAPPPLAAFTDRLPARPDLRALALEARAAELEARAAGRWWVPELELGAGIKAVDTGAGRDAGLAAGVTLPLPLLSRDQDERLRAGARTRAARARLSLALDAARAEVAGLHAEVDRLAAAAARHRAEGGAEPGGLLRTAEAAYRGGEVGVLELVDAYRAALEAELSLVELDWAARRARVDLERAAGGASR